MCHNSGFSLFLVIWITYCWFDVFICFLFFVSFLEMDIVMDIGYCKATQNNLNELLQTFRVSLVFSVDFWYLIMFLQEQELYQKEGLGVNEVHYVDNQDCIGESVPASLLWPHLLLKLIKWLISAFSKWPNGSFVLWWSICKSTTQNVLISFGRMVFNPSRDFMLLCFFSLICYLVSVRTLDGSVSENGSIDWHSGAS